MDSKTQTERSADWTFLKQCPCCSVSRLNKHDLQELHQKLHRDLSPTEIAIAEEINRELNGKWYKPPQA